MEFSHEVVLPASRGQLWPLLVDVRRMAACVPGCEDVDEVEALRSYRARLRQRVGPFRVEVPIEIRINEIREPELIRASATGRDRTTGTTVGGELTVTLTCRTDDKTCLTVRATLQVVGRLAALGYPIIKRHAEQNLEQFGSRLTGMLGES